MAIDVDELDVSVLVPVLNEGAAIRATVAGIQAQRFGGTIEFLFADGGSTDGTREQLEELAAQDARIRVLDNPRRGTASGLNVCLAHARGHYVARMDAHTAYTPDYVRLGVERLQRGDVAWVAGSAVPDGRGVVARTVAAALGTWIGRGSSRKWADSDEGTDERELDTGVFGGVWRRADVLAQHGWDEGWPRNQDSEMAARFLRAGERIVMLEGMGARYQPRDSLPALFHQYRHYGFYRAKTARRHPMSLRPTALLPPLVALDAAAAVLAPDPLRRLARAGLVFYAGAVASAAVQTARRGRLAEAALLPAVLAAMHAAHGLGFLEGAARLGPPWQALARATGVRNGPVPPYLGPVDAPSLDEA
jgi:succinoglycan biosynthesis protein ExoA